MLLINRLKITIIFIFYFPYTVPPIHTPILGRSKGRVSHHWSENLEIELFFIQKEETKSKRKTAKTFLPSSLNPAVSRWKTQKWAIFLIRVKESKRRGKTTKKFLPSSLNFEAFSWQHNSKQFDQDKKIKRRRKTAKRFYPRRWILKLTTQIKYFYQHKERKRRRNTTQKDFTFIVEFWSLSCQHLN